MRRLLILSSVVGLAFALGAGGLVWRSAEGHRRTAERLLQDQADFLADQYGNSAQTLSWYAVRSQLHAWRSVAAPGRAFPAPARIGERLATVAIGPALATRPATAWFRLDGARFRVLPAAGPLDRARVSEWHRALADRLATAPPAPDAFAYVLAPAGEVLFVTADRAGWAGFVTPLAAWHERIFGPLTDHLRLSADSADRTTISVRVSDPEGRVLFETAPGIDPTACIGRARMSGSLSASVEVTYPESGVTAVVPGGLPASPLATAILVTILLCVALMAALFLMHRALTLALLRSEFTSTISHELRTPLTQILLYAETLGRDRPLAPDQRASAVAIITREARRLVQMVENVLALSSVGRPGLRVVRRRERVDRLVEEVLAGFAPVFRARRVTSRSLVAIPLEAEVDADAVRQVLINLVDNALRHGPDGQTLTVSALRAGGAVVLSVEDQGPGIPDADHDRVWRPFVRLSPGAGSAGSGIGLAVVRQLIRLHGGTAVIERAPGGGARITVTFAEAAGGGD